MESVLLVSKPLVIDAGKVGRNELNTVHSCGSERASGKSLTQSLQVEGIMR